MISPVVLSDCLLERSSTWALSCVSFNKELLFYIFLQEKRLFFIDFLEMLASQMIIVLVIIAGCFTFPYIQQLQIKGNLGSCMKRISTS